MSKVDVLDHGYVRVRSVTRWVDEDVTDLDLFPVNAARVSYDKQSKQLTKGDLRLLNYLSNNKHTSPYRHAVIGFEVYAPLMVMRQWGKYRVGSAWMFEDSDDPIETWNESSRRYVTEEPEFYVPDVWRSAPENSKQGSGEPLPSLIGGRDLSVDLEMSVYRAQNQYEQMLEHGVCAEQARLFLPAYAMYVRAYWTVSLAGVLHFLEQRLEEDSQWEIQQFAQAVRTLSQPLFPESFKAFDMYKENN